MIKSSIASWIALILMIWFMFNNSPFTFMVAIYFALEGTILSVKEEISVAELKEIHAELKEILEGLKNEKTIR